MRKIGAIEHALLLMCKMLESPPTSSGLVAVKQENVYNFPSNCRRGRRIKDFSLSVRIPTRLTSFAAG
jgi:hypothetical protein